MRRLVAALGRAAGDAGPAREGLEAAFRTFGAIGAEFEVARTRLGHELTADQAERLRDAAAAVKTALGCA